jgi:hypothetical protein
MIDDFVLMIDYSFFFVRIKTKIRQQKDIKT